MVLLVTLEKIAILVPQKLSFLRYSDGIFSKVTRRTVAFSPKGNCMLCLHKEIMLAFQ